MSFSAAIPGAWAALAAASANLSTQLAALAQFQATIDFGSLSAGIALAGQISAALTAALSIGITPPSVSAQFAIIAALVAALQAQLDIIMGLVNLTGTMQVYTYDGPVDSMGAELTTELSSGFPGGGGGSAHCNALILAATESATWSAMGQVFKLTP